MQSQTIQHNNKLPFGTLPVVSCDHAVRKVRHGKYRTVGKRNPENHLEIFLCTSSGKPVAIVDFPVERSEVSE